MPTMWVAQWRRTIVFVALTSVMLSLLATLTNPAWTDEVFYVEPGASLALGKGFLSNGWSQQGHGVTWGLSNPGLPVAISAWFRLFGFGQLSSHAFFFFVQLSGAVALSRWVQSRHGFSCVGLLIVTAACMMLHSLAGNMVFHARHDAFALLLFAWFLWYSFEESQGWMTWSAAFAFGVACVFFGTQFCGYFALAAAVLFLWRRDKATFLSGLSLAFGLLAGLLLLRFAYTKMGVWQAFLDNRAENFGRAFSMDKFYVSKDFLALIPACLGLVLFEVFAGRGWRTEVAIVGWLGLALLTGIPVIIQHIGLWQAPFSWMITVPLLLVAMPVCMRSAFRGGGWFVLVPVGLFAVSCLVRLKELRTSMAEIGRRAAVVSEFRQLSAPDDVALGSMSLYYELRASGREVYWPYERLLPPWPEIAKKARWMVLAEVDEPILTGVLGGEWERVFVSEGSAPPGPQGRYLILRRRPSP